MDGEQLRVSLLAELQIPMNQLHEFDAAAGNPEPGIGARASVEGGKAPVKAWHARIRA